MSNESFEECTEELLQQGFTIFYWFKKKLILNKFKFPANVLFKNIILCGRKRFLYDSSRIELNRYRYYD